jgi:transposase
VEGGLFWQQKTRTAIKKQDMRSRHSIIMLEEGGLEMLSKSRENSTSQMQIVSVDQLVPEDHLLRKIDAAIDFSFIYDLVEDRYCQDNGRPSIDPVTLIKIPIIQYMYGIKSMRQTIKEIEVNVAYRWFLGLDFYDKVPHFSTFGKNYKRRFEGTDLFEQIFTKILLQCMKQGLVDTDTMFVDATHVKAAANRKKAKKILVAKRSTKYLPNLHFVIVVE